MKTTLNRYDIGQLQQLVESRNETVREMLKDGLHSEAGRKVYSAELEENVYLLSKLKTDYNQQATVTPTNKQVFQKVNKMANHGRKFASGVNTLVTISSVKLDPNSKAYKKAIANSKGVLNGNPDIYQNTTKLMNTKLARKLGYVKQGMPAMPLREEGYGGRLKKCRGTFLCGMHKQCLCNS